LLSSFRVYMYGGSDKLHKSTGADYERFRNAKLAEAYHISVAAIDPHESSCTANSCPKSRPPIFLTKRGRSPGRELDHSHFGYKAAQNQLFRDASMICWHANCVPVLVSKPPRCFMGGSQISGVGRSNS
jgi:hypothetical protein